MALTYTLLAGAAYAQLAVTYTDEFGINRTISYPVIPAATQAQIGAVLAALEPLSNAAICEYSFAGQKWDIDGQEAATAAVQFNSNYERVELEYVSADRCKDRIMVAVPAPVPGMFTGINKVIVLPTFAPLVAFNAAFTAIAISKTGATDLQYSHGFRVSDMLPKPTIV